MKEEVKCPRCGGDKFREQEDNKYKCLYCNTVFTVKNKEQKPEVLPSRNQIDSPSNVTVNVKVDNPQQASPKNSFGNQMAKGAANGAGVVAGGCFTATLISILTPIIYFIFILIFIQSCVHSCTSAL